jgi:hypothetical protein
MEIPHGIVLHKAQWNPIKSFEFLTKLPQSHSEVKTYT